MNIRNWYWNRIWNRIYLAWNFEFACNNCVEQDKLVRNMEITTAGRLSVASDIIHRRLSVNLQPSDVRRWQSPPTRLSVASDVIHIRPSVKLQRTDVTDRRLLEAMCRWRIYRVTRESFVRGSESALKYHTCIVGVWTQHTHRTLMSVFNTCQLGMVLTIDKCLLTVQLSPFGVGHNNLWIIKTDICIYCYIFDESFTVVLHLDVAHRSLRK